jgi:prolyl 4-hydroxylase
MSTALEEARRLFAAGAAPAAIAHVEQAASANDVEAICALANWRLFGLYGPRDPAAAHQWLQRGVALGAAEPTRLLATLMSNGTGCASDPEGAAQLLASRLPDDPETRLQLQTWHALRASAPPGPAEPLTEQQTVVRIPGVLTEAGCRHIRRIAEPRLRPSFVVDPQTGQRRPHPVRSSMSVGLGPDLEDLVVGFVNNRIAQLSGTERAQGEPLHVLRYQGEQQYRLHSDALPGAANQRSWTLLLYLNEDYEGGETVFPALGLSIKGRLGEALLFRNLDEAGQPDPLMRHAGLAVSQGTKWLATRWIRQNPLRPDAAS